MNALLLKDLVNLKRSFKMLIFIVAIFGIIFIPTGGLAGFLCILMFIAVSLTINSLAYDNIAEWDEYALTMPISRKDIVSAKYRLLIMFIACGFIISIAFIAALYFALPQLFAEFVNPFIQTVIVFCVGIILGSVMLPITYKFGTEHARYIMIIVMIFFGIIVGASLFLFSEMIPSINSILFTILFFAVSLIALLLSWIISNKIYANKEF
ncbi:MAG TPA: ABC-2 transporter permease [Methanocorpusculum sp.]|nr:ABC-2 transporter permease [Methanocorpusculum sp.]